MNAGKNVTRIRQSRTRALDARGCEAAVLAAVIAAQHAGLEELADDLTQLHRRAGDARRSIETADASGAAA